MPGLGAARTHRRADRRAGHQSGAGRARCAAPTTVVDASGLAQIGGAGGNFSIVAMFCAPTSS